VNPEVDQPAYVFALSQIEGVGARSLPRVLKLFPSRETLIGTPQEVVEQRLGQHLPRNVIFRLYVPFEQTFASARQLMLRHLENDVIPIALTDHRYPPLLKLIPDPPAVLFVRGTLEAPSSAEAIAVVGTRSPTERGKEVAGRVARYFGSSGYVIVSGLAKGIDTAAHKGALDAGAKTVAVLGTPPDQIYPAENRGLADRIIAESGALITELPLGRRAFRNAFVQRDRIQSGMALAVVPVQTDVAGGTMHTVKFAEAQGRLVLCPKPLAGEQHLKQYAGVIDLISSGRAREFQADQYESLIALLRENRLKLLHAYEDAESQGAETDSISLHRQPGETHRSQDVQVPLGFLNKSMQEVEVREDQVDRIVEIIRALKLDSSKERFDRAVSRVHEKLFGSIGSQKKDSKLP
jgi:DNA processing protein